MKSLDSNGGRPAFCVFIFGLLFVVALSGGCAAPYAERLTAIRRDFYEVGDVELAKKELERREKKAPAKEKDVLALDAACLELCAGNVESAKKRLIEVRDRFDELETQNAKKATENVLQFWLDDNATSYGGEDYEKITIRALLAIADLLGDGEDARAFAYQIAAKQDEIVRNGAVDDPQNPGKKTNPKTAYPRVPLGPYLEGLLAEETFVDQNEAARLYEKVVNWRPEFQQGAADLERAQIGVHSQPGNGRVYVFAFVGRGPYKEQVYSPATQLSLLIADQIFSAFNEYSVPPTIAPVPIPALVVQEPSFACVGVDVDGTQIAATETIFDVNETAIRQFEATKDQIIARAVVRRIVKKGTIYAAQKVGQVNDWVALAANVGGVVWEATETADVRCWGLLPAEIQVASFELPAGERRITLYPGNRQGDRVGAQLAKTIRVPENRNVYLFVNFPDRDPVGTVVSSR